jgi:hypothetical protein
MEFLPGFITGKPPPVRFSGRAVRAVNFLLRRLGKTVLVCVSRGLIMLSVMERHKAGWAKYAPLRRNGGFWVYPNRTPH